MGLDMYLFKGTYVRNECDTPHEDRNDFEIKQGGKIRKDIKPERICWIVEEVAYWRKFHALHAWFIHNCKNGVDDFQKSYVRRENLEKLLEILIQIQADNSKAPELLPCQDHCCSGSIGYDDAYFEHVNSTVTMLENILHEAKECYFEYHSIW